MKIPKALQNFLVQLEADGRSFHTIAQYERHVRLFAHWCADVGHRGDIKKITHEDVARFLASRQARTAPDGHRKKASSVNALRTSLKCFFSYLRRAEYIPQDPGRLIRRAICGTPPPRILTHQEESLLMETLAAAEGPEARRDHILFHLMLATGIRLGSAVALDVEDVDLDSGTIHLRHTKGDREEVVFLGKTISEHLLVYLDGKSSGAMFTTRQGRRPSTRHIQRRFTMWVKNAKIARPASCHWLRHTFATRLYRRTGDVFLVKEALRHRSVASTLVYARADDRRLRRVIASGL